MNEGVVLLFVFCVFGGLIGQFIGWDIIRGKAEREKIIVTILKINLPLVVGSFLYWLITSTGDPYGLGQVDRFPMPLHWITVAYMSFGAGLEIMLAICWFFYDELN